MRNLWIGILRVLGLFLALISCLPMLAMLPASFVALLALIGLTAAPILTWTAPLAPIAPYLLILSIVFLVVGHLRCGWQPASVAAAGGLLVYLAMYLVVVPATTNPEPVSTPLPATMEMMPGIPTAEARSAMDGMTQATPAATASMAMPGMIGRTNAPLFYAGVLLIVRSFGLVVWRRRAHICRPLNPLSFVRAGFPARRN